MPRFSRGAYAVLAVPLRRAIKRAFHNREAEIAKLDNHAERILRRERSQRAGGLENGRVGRAKP
jgi:hypothetical protein